MELKRHVPDKTKLADSAGATINPATQEGLDAILAAVQEVTMPTATVTANTVGDTLVYTPTSGMKLRLYWFSYGVDPNASDHPTAYLKFGATGTPIYKVPLNKNGSLFAHNVKGGEGYVEGDADEPLYIVLDKAQTVHINIDFTEV